MKTQVTILLLLISSVSFSQGMSESRAIKEKHIDFSKEVLYFELSGKIEIDGHIEDNKKRECPLIYIANLDEVRITDTCTKTDYIHRKCNKNGCKIIHLTKKNEITINDLYLPYWNNVYQFTPD